MKYLKRIALVLALACFMSLVFSSCDMLANLGGLGNEVEDPTDGGNGFINSELDGINKIEIVDGDLIITLADGNVVNMGPVDDSKGTLGLEFYPLPDGTYGVAVGKAHFLNQIVIPSTYKGCAVTQILEGGFTYSEVERITIPSSITYIGERAFWGCSDLSSITFDGSVSEAERLGENGWNNNGHHNVSVSCNNGVFTVGSNDPGNNTPGNGDETEGWEDESSSSEWEENYRFEEYGTYYNGEFVTVLKSTNRYVDNSVCEYYTYAEVTGYMTFDYRVSSESSCDVLEVYVNGTCVLSDSGETGYHSYSDYVHYGDLIRFVYQKDGSVNNGEDCAYILDLQFTDDYEEETTEAPFDESYEENYYFEETGEYYNGEYVSVYKSTNTNINYSTCVMTRYATESGYMTFDYKVSSESGCDVLRVYVNGSQVFSASGEEGYDSFSYYVYSGDLISFEYEKDGSISSGDDRAYIRDLKFGQDGEAPEIGTEEIESFEFCQFEMYETYYNGEYVNALKSTNTSDNSASQYLFEAYSSGYLRFDYKVSSESSYDRLLVYINDDLVLDDSGESGYISFEYTVSIGDSIAIEYNKDESQSSGEDCAYIYDIRIE